MDIIDQIINEDMVKSLANDPLETTLLGDEDLDDPEFVDYLQMLDSLPRVSRFRAPFEPLHTEERSTIIMKPSLEEPPTLELKPLPKHLRYAYLGNSNS